VLASLGFVRESLSLPNGLFTTSASYPYVKILASGRSLGRRSRGQKIFELFAADGDVARGAVMIDVLRLRGFEAIPCGLVPGGDTHSGSAVRGSISISGGEAATDM